MVSRKVSCHTGIVCEGMANIRSRFSRSKPALRRMSYDLNTIARECTRPKRSSKSSSSDCTPMEMRVTPPSRRSFALSADTVAGLHSTVHSFAPSSPRRLMASKSVSHCRRFKIDGVPPPKKIVCGVRSSATNSSSRTNPATNRSTVSPSGACEKNAQ